MLNTLYKPILELNEFEKLKKLETGVVDIEGVNGSAMSNIIYGCSRDYKRTLIVTDNEVSARQLLADYMMYSKSVTYYPPKDLIFYQADLSGKLLMQERMNVYASLAADSEATVITTIDALLEKSVDLSRVLMSIVKIEKDTDIDEEELSKKLIKLGYEKTAMVSGPGQYAIRGGIIDIFSLTEDNPYRVELFGDTVDSIRVFDVTTQRSIDSLNEFSVFPASDMILSTEEKLRGLVKIEEEAEKYIEELREGFKTKEAYQLKTAVAGIRDKITEGYGNDELMAYSSYFYDNKCSLIDLFDKDDTLLVLVEPAHLSDKSDDMLAEFAESMARRMDAGLMLPSQMNILMNKDDLSKEISKFRAIAFNTLNLKQAMYKALDNVTINAKTVPSYQNSFEALISDLEKYKKKKYRCLLLCPSRTRGNRLAADLNENGLTAFFSEDLENREIQPGEIMVGYAHVNKGFELPDIKFVVISESDIFKQSRRKKKKHKNYEGQSISSFSELSTGDYVVHENHGLGIYQGIEQIEVNHVAKDYMKISYRDGGNLYVLATDFNVIQKYSSADGKAPKLNKLGTQEWTKTKAKVKSAVSEIAHELVELYARRQEKNGYVYGPDTVWQKEFEEMFPYEETDDQNLAIDATKKDMQSSKIMDRLICGDVGFGKTEVAIRAAFKAVQDGKQVALLVPTTILAEQHYSTFCERMKSFPVTIDLLCRFRTTAQQKQTIKDIEKGMCDIVIGTHRLLSKDVKFKDLGLLIIDEEQRFGVGHKEKIKQIRKDVDVLALSATPIPRTLHMSLVGIRDMSVLEEAPQDRLPIQTFVMEYNDEMVREAIGRELKRGGQVYYVYNRVNTIANIADEIKALVPHANVAFAHGQMKEDELESIMHDFINKEIDVLISTTIIETGMDIPNVNTIIVHDSDRMGLSQLYQLRGRVGRSNRTAYAFLLYKRDKLLKEEAEKRLSVIKEYTDLGSGFKIAMKDLEIRGAGNILGKSQHGHMEAVGYDLYCKMLNEAVKSEKGEAGTEDFDAFLDINVDAFIPESYVSNENAKLDLYKRIAVVQTDDEASDLMDEMTDRYGNVPANVRTLLDISLLKEKARKVYVKDVSDKDKYIQFDFYEHALINPGNLPELINSYDGRLTLKTLGNPCLLYNKEENDSERILEIIDKVLTDMQILID